MQGPGEWNRWREEVSFIFSGSREWPRAECQQLEQVLLTRCASLQRELFSSSLYLITASPLTSPSPVNHNAFGQLAPAPGRN